LTYVAPAGTVLRTTDLVGGFAKGLGLRRTEELGRVLERVSAAPRCLPISSGRAAMTVIFAAMRAGERSHPRRDEVIIPAYTCYSVAASAIRAGLTPRLCDVDPRTLGLDPSALEKEDFSRVLAVVSANLYGLPNELGEIERIARDRGVYLLDDAAQALGARVAGRAVGTFGDAGLFSFDKGKIICTIQGGAVVAHDNELGRRLVEAVEALPRSGSVEALSNSAKLVAYAMLLHPRCYGVVQAAPFLGLGRTVFETRYPITRLGALQAGVAVELAGRLDELNDQRRRNADQLATALRGLPHIELPIVANDAHAVYARFPIRITDPRLREQAVARLNRHGIGATTSYPLALADVPEVKAVLRHPTAELLGARQVAAQVVTLPTHGYCPPDIGKRVAQLLEARGGASPEFALRDV
jgi:dTDP-4-amino-4,6-dideoxygalactose transaminase